MPMQSGRGTRNSYGATGSAVDGPLSACALDQNHDRHHKQHEYTDDHRLSAIQREGKEVRGRRQDHWRSIAGVLD